MTVFPVPWVPWQLVPRNKMHCEATLASKNFQVQMALIVL